MKVKLNGIPLRIVDWSETSQIVTLLTDKLGKVTGVARGAHRLRSNFDGPFDHLCHYQVIWFRGPRAQLGQFTESYLHSRPAEFRLNRATQNWALSCVERARELTEDEDPSPAYHELRQALGHMIQGEDPRRIHNIFSIRLLRHLGFGPVTTYCVAHGVARRSQKAVPYSSRLGGVLCPQCTSQDPGSVPLSFRISDYIECVRNQISTKSLNQKDEKTLTRLLTETVQHILGKALRLARYSYMLLFILTFLTACQDERSPRELYDDALTLFEEDRWIRAGWRVSDLRDQYPESVHTPDILWVQSLDLLRRGKGGEASDILVELLNVYPDHRHFSKYFHSLYSQLKLIFEENATIEEGRLQYNVSGTALEMMESMAQFAPYSSVADEALMYVADARLGRQEFEEAELLYRDILSRVDRESSLEIRAQYHLALSLWDRAVIRIRGFFDRHLRNPTEPLSQSDRLIAIRYSDRYPQEAAREFKEVIRRFPESSEAEVSLRILEEIDKMEAARFFALGNFYRFYGKMESARYYYRRLVLEHPEAEAATQAQIYLDEILEP